MKISHEWLRAFVPHSLTPRAAGELLSDHTVTLDGIAPLRADLVPFVVARVIESEKIPETKLSFNKVDDGSGTLLEVVCGAPNVTVGALYPFARTGTVMPAGLTIEKRKIRGFTSNGMLCSARELGLGEDHDGILALTVDVPPGTPLLSAMPIGDTQLDLDVLPNRPDLLSHRGMARELSALTGVPMEIPAELRDLRPAGGAPTGLAERAAPRAQNTGASDTSPSGVSVTVEDADGAPHYIAVVIRGVKVEPSPAWLAQRVESVGGRSINNVVDATNYVLHGYGQPVHAFDLAKLAKNSIVVRKAKAGESLVTLDGVTRKLEPWMTIIADGENATALAGVMGGKASEVTETTTDILLEVAHFSPRAVRKVRRALGLSTDASYRFERGVDGGATTEVAAIAAWLIVSLAGGKLESVLDVGAAPPAPAPVKLRPKRVDQLLGVHVEEEEIERLLSSVGFVVDAGADRTYSVTPPTWRHDVLHEVDLIEEVARLRGYNKLPDDLRPYRLGTVPDHPLHATARRVRDALVAAGLSETRPMPFTKGSPDVRLPRVANPLAEDEPFLRDSILDTLARRAEYNLNQHEGNVRIFEIGSVFTRGMEEVRVGALIMGARRPAHFTDPKPPAFDAWDAKALGERIARAAYPGENVELHTFQRGTLWSVDIGSANPVPEVGPEQDGSHFETFSIGVVHLGLVSVIALDAPVWASPAFGVEMRLGMLSAAPEALPGKHDYRHAEGSEPSHFSRVTPLPTTPAAEFDLALIVKNERTAAEVERFIRNESGELLERLELFDEFRGAGIPEGTRSLAWRLTFRHPERTLRDKEIDGRRSQLLKALEKELGVVPRTA